MLKILRKKGVSKIVLWCIATTIIITFVFWGSYSYVSRQGTSKYAGKLYGKNIDYPTFDSAYKNVNIQAILRYGENFNKIKQYLNLEAETWDRLILLHEVDKRKITVKDEDVINTIEGYPFFQRNGQFDSLLYNDTVKYVFNTIPRQFEENIRENIRFTKLFEAETSSITVNDAEVLEAYKDQNEKVQISYAIVKFDQFAKEIPFDETQGQAYYNEHKTDYIVPPTVNVDYIQIDFPSGEKADKAPAREKAEAIYKQLSEPNANFTDIAKKNGINIQNSGFFSMDQPNLALGFSYELLNNIFQLEPNKFIKPFETEKGMLIAIMKEKRDPYAPEYSEVKDKIRAAINKDKTIEIATQKSQEFAKIIKDKMLAEPSKDFPAIAKSLNLEIQQTPVFNRGQYLPQIGISKTFQDAAFALSEQNKLSDPVEIPNGFAILYLDNYTPADEKEFEKTKDRIKDGLLNQKKNEAFSNYLSKLRLEANLIDSLPKPTP